MVTAREAISKIGGQRSGASTTVRLCPLRWIVTGRRVPGGTASMIPKLARPRSGSVAHSTRSPARSPAFSAAAQNSASAATSASAKVRAPM
jgi:hypothetical protein